MEQLLTRGQALDHFAACGLSYEDITLRKLRYLEIELNSEFNKVYRECLDGKRKKPLYWVQINHAKYYKGQYDPADGHLIHAHMTAQGTYFNARNVIDFCSNGHIEFCYEADDINTQPVLKAFITWCDWLKGEKDHGKAQD